MASVIYLSESGGSCCRQLTPCNFWGAKVFGLLIFCIFYFWSSRNFT